MNPSGTINGIDYQFYIDQLYVKQYPDTPNAVAKVRWACVMKRNKGKLLAMGDIELSKPDSENFINIASLDAATVLSWVIAAHGGEAWLNELIAGHEPHMAQSEAEAVFEAWHVPLLNPLKFDPKNV